MTSTRRSSRPRSNRLANPLLFLSGRRLVLSACLALPLVATAQQGVPAPEVPNAEQLLQREIEGGATEGQEGPMRIRRAIPVNPQDRRAVPDPPPIDPAAAAPAPAPIPRAIPVERTIPRAIPVNPAPGATPPAAEPTPAPAPETAAPAQAAAPVPAPAPESPAADSGPPVPRAEPVASSSGPGAAELAVADGFFAREMWDLALQKYAEYLSTYARDPGRQTALYRAAESALRLEKPAEARIFYTKLLQEFREGPFYGPAAYRMADFYFKESNFAQAALYFGRAADRLAEPSLSLSSRFYEGRSLEKLGRRSEASRAYTVVSLATEETPFKEIAQISLARLEVEAGLKASGLEMYEKLLKTGSKPEIRSEATVQAGLLAAELGKTDQAVEYLNRSIEDSTQAQWRGQAALVIMRVLASAERFSEVIQTYEKWGELIPRADRPEMMLLTATAYRRQGDFDRSTRMLQEVFEGFGQSPEAREAEYQYLLGLYQAKEDGLAQRVDVFLEKYPTGQQADRAALLKAEFLFGKGQYAEAAQAYQRVVNSDLSAEIKAEGIYRQAWSYWELKDMTQAVLKFNQFIGNHPQHPLVPKALVQRALAYTQNRQFELALNDFDRIVRQYPDAKAERELALQKKALIQGQLGDNEEMVASFRQLLKEYPETSFASQAWWWIGQGSYTLRDYPSTVEAMKKARELDPEMYGERGSIYVMLGYYGAENFDELTKEVTEYSSKEHQLRVPDEVVLWLGRKSFADGKMVEAEKFLTLAVESPTHDPLTDAALLLGQARAKLGKEELSIAAFDKYLENTNVPIERARGLLEKARALIEMGSFDEALKAIEEAMRLQPEGRVNGEGRLVLGDVEAARKNWAEAAKIYDGVSILYSKDPEITPEALRKGAEAYTRAGDSAKATELRNELNTKFPDFSQR